MTMHRFQCTVCKTSRTYGNSDDSEPDCRQAWLKCEGECGATSGAVTLHLYVGREQATWRPYLSEGDQWKKPGPARA